MDKEKPFDTLGDLALTGGYVAGVFAATYAVGALASRLLFGESLHRKIAEIGLDEQETYDYDQEEVSEALRRGVSEILDGGKNDPIEPHDDLPPKEYVPDAVIDVEFSRGLGCIIYRENVSRVDGLTV